MPNWVPALVATPRPSSPSLPYPVGLQLRSEGQRRVLSDFRSESSCAFSDPFPLTAGAPPPRREWQRGICGHGAPCSYAGRHAGARSAGG